MKYYPMVWILWCNDSFSLKVKLDDKQGVHIEELFAHKIDAEEYMRTCEKDDQGGRYWIQEKEVIA
jgi:hypothetical protein